MSGYPIIEQNLISGEQGSGKDLSITTESIGVLCEGTGAIPFGGGVAGDSLLVGLVILQNATAVTASVSGMHKRDSSGNQAAQLLVFTGSTTADVVVNLPAGIINSAGALRVTSSVNQKVIVMWRGAQ